jgi:dihydroflavonol-4-reductase
VPGDPVLVTGGSGTVGRALVERLVADHREVRALARSPEAEATVASLGAVPARGDALDESSLVAAARGCTTVFHAAGVNAMCRRDPRPMYETNVEGSANVVRAAARAGVARLVYTSSASAIGEPHGTIGREDSPHRGSYLSHYERSKHLAERRVLSLAAELDLAVVAVNPSSVQGPGRTSGSARLILDLMNGRLPILVDRSVSIVDIADCAAGHVLAESRGVPGERYLLSGSTVTTRAAVDLVRRLWGRPRRVWWMPGAVVHVAGVATEAIGKLVRRDVPICREAVLTVLHGHRYDGSRAERELGLTYTPLEETLARTLAWYASRGLVPPPAPPR